MKLNITTAYRNTLLELFGNPTSVTRRIKSDIVINFLDYRWNGIANPTEDIFWLSVAGHPDPLSLSQFLAFLATDHFPLDEWYVRKLGFRSLTVGEQQSLVDAIAEAASSWSFSSSSVQPGLREVLETIAGICIGSVRIATKFERLDLEPLSATLSKLVSETTQFYPDVSDWPTVYDVERAFDFFWQFYMDIPHTIALSERFKRSALDLGQCAWDLMTKFESNRGYLDLVDGSLLPWAILHGSANAALSIQEITALARDRFGNRTAKLMGNEDLERTAQFQFDGYSGFDEVEMSSTGEKLDNIPKGAYSFVGAKRAGIELVKRLKLPPISQPQFEPKARLLIGDEWCDTESAGPVTLRDLIDGK